MPKDNIERAIARGSGADADAKRTRRSSTRATAPAASPILVEALTDNRNRTASDVRSCFSKHDGNLGASGAVAWQFDRRGIVLVDAEGVDEDELMLAARTAARTTSSSTARTFQITALAGVAAERARGASRRRASRSRTPS